MSHGRKPLLALLFVAFVGVSSEARGQAPIDRVGQALDELQRWLGEDDNARQWKKILRTDELVQQLSLGGSADRAQVAAIHAAFAGSNPALTRPRFVAVRTALEDWLSTIPVPVADLPAAMRGARDQFRATAPEAVAAARQELLANVQALENFLAGGGEAKATAWKQFLQWDEMRQELDREGGPRPRALQTLAERYQANEKGLELPVFVAVRQALTKYAYAAFFAEGTQARQAYEQRLEEIARRLESFQQNPSAEDAAAMGIILGWMERGGQVPHLVESVRKRFDHPNFFATVSQRLAAAGVDNEEVRAKLNRPQAVRDVILKTSIRGHAYPNLSMGLGMVPSQEQAVLDVHLTGAASSQNVGYRGPVTLHTSGYTSIHAVQRIYFDEFGLTSSAPSARCTTSTQIHDIAAGCRLIENLAWKQAGKSRAQAERIASQHAAARIERQLGSELGHRLRDANQSYTDRFRNRLARRDGFPRLFRASTTDRQLSLRLLHANPQQLAASTPPPELAEGHDLAVRVHESFVGNFGESLLGGITLSDERLVELLTEAKAEIPEELQITPDKDPWSITFMPERPVTATFSGDTARIAIRCRRFTRGDREVTAVVEIAATYQLAKSGTGSKLTRQGDVFVDYIGTERQSAFQIGMKSFLRKKFEALFKPEITSDGLLLPEQLRSAGKLQLRQLKADQGWLTLGWQRPEGAANLAWAGRSDRVLP